jgi:hypothetical protein
MVCPAPYNKQLQRTSYGVTCAPHVRRFMLHMRRAGQFSARPLNCSVMRQP